MLTWARSQRRTERQIQMQATPHTFGVGCRSDERAEFLINDRLSFMRFLGLGLEDRVPDARTIWLFREKLTTAGAIKRLFEQFDAMLRQAGYIA